ncbi:WecB/TagA/CpsF family glycosyltransferase [Dyadobacter tibetensis]|uniref:WecB/TagA/CpsF family glycosyltransferase n=1 Tax=Dyadobacter tibetensis TaxID=1211851 RepID=UPI000470A35D|nr:WecB/TagA/CpsF family glycosyltransferase [Dyadobacter tibetensis]
MPIERLTEKREFLNCNISIGSYRAFINTLTLNAATLTSTTVCVANVHMLVEANQDIFMQAILNRADVVTPDGMPLAKGLEIIYGAKQDRVAGMDLLPSLIEEAAKRGIGVFFYGSTDEVLNAMIKRATSEYPHLNVAGAYSPPFRAMTEEEDQEVISMINKVQPGFVFVGLGCPKQEKWMFKMQGKIHSVMIGLGGAFPVYARTQTRAPQWMQDKGLEWLFRLYQEPGRLWKRYLVTNTIFMKLFAQEYYHKVIRGKVSHKERENWV